MRIKTFLKSMVLVICVGVILYAFLAMGTGRGPLDYNEHLEDTAFTVDEKNVTFEDLAFYILFEERKVEEQARIYNKEYTKDYWNIHTNDKFIQSEAKSVVLGMAVHDHLFYQLAVAEGMDELTDAEEKELEGSIADFWEDMLDVQWERLPCDKATINNQIRIAAIAEKYGNHLARENNTSQAAYKYDGYYYSLIKDTHDIKLNKKLWNKLVLGDITLTHSKLNYINGLTDEDKKKSKK
ncbi:hypothetical protein SAMN04487830_11120 [Pseudobutyrivibrio sp. OR37]|uniref:hypothetical protein n=1 Tax=Pseudobutyrivibrio sp. OR37 TaxID=1798186 RepID=UPI0008EE8A02|nr:hypothetical protein [Pseudobutyrivibrio sp. OR37]SFH87477.1 hypothetical protein SAMN04487830_11120 [Pseudobutyrivibrio sp. OR37]